MIYCLYFKYNSLSYNTINSDECVGYYATDMWKVL